MLSYLHHCLSTSLLKTLHFFELLPSYANVGRPLQLGALLETAEQFVLYLKPAVPLKDCYNEWYEEPQLGVETVLDKEVFIVAQVLVQTCHFMAEVICGKVKRSQLQTLNDQVHENTLLALQILKKVLADPRSYALLVVANFHSPGRVTWKTPLVFPNVNFLFFFLFSFVALVSQLKASCEASGQQLSQGPKVQQQTSKDLRPILDQLGRIQGRRYLMRANSPAQQASFQDPSTNNLPSLSFLFFIHYKVRRSRQQKEERKKERK